MRLPVVCVLVAAASWPRACALGDRPLAALPTGPALPAVYRRLRDAATEPLLEIPAPTLTGEGERTLAQSESMYFSTFHWLPLVNGHTGYAPWWWRHFAWDLQRLPDAPALRTLIDFTAVRWILVRRGRVAPEEFARWEALASSTPDLVRMSEQGADDLLLRVRLPQRRPWAQALAAGRPAPGRTILGTPLASLAGTAHGRLECRSIAPSVSPGALLPVGVNLENSGPGDWPGLGSHADSAHLVVLRATWRSAESPGQSPETTIPLPRDVIAGEAFDFVARIDAPGQVGSYTLTVTLEQIGDPPLVAVANARLAVEVR